MSTNCGSRTVRAIGSILPNEAEQWCCCCAAATGRTKTFYAREAILEHIDDLEDVYLAEQRLIDIRAGRIKTIALDAIITSDDLAD